jgi:hypothetical protein
MKYPTEQDVKKVGPIIRGLSTFILLCSIIALAGLVFAAIIEPFHPLLIVGVIVIGLMSHVSANIVFKGYAPKYLLFAHGPKENT